MRNKQPRNLCKQMSYAHAVDMSGHQEEAIRSPEPDGPGPRERREAKRLKRLLTVFNSDDQKPFVVHVPGWSFYHINA